MMSRKIRTESCHGRRRRRRPGRLEHQRSAAFPTSHQFINKCHLAPISSGHVMEKRFGPDAGPRLSRSPSRSPSPSPGACAVHTGPIMCAVDRSWWRMTRAMLDIHVRPTIPSPITTESKKESHNHAVLRCSILRTCLSPIPPQPGLPSCLTLHSCRNVRSVGSGDACVSQQFRIQISC